MAMSGNVDIDLRNADLLDWVSQRHSHGDVFNLRESIRREERGLELGGSIRNEPGHLGEFVVITAIRRQYEIRRYGQPISDNFVTMPLHTTLKVLQGTALGLLPSLPQASKDAVIKGFSDYKFLTDGPLEPYVVKKMTEFNSTALPAQKISTDSFDLFSDSSFEITKIELDDTKEKWFQACYSGQIKLPGLSREGLRSEGYELRRVGDEYLTYFPDETHSRQHIEVPPGELKYADDIVRSAALDKARDADCNPSDIITVRVADVPLPDGIMVKWEWAYINNGCGGGFHFWKPVKYYRKEEMVLYATSTFNNFDMRLKNVFEECLKDAALQAGVTAILTENFELGLAAFKQLFWACIKRRLNELIKCLLPDLYIVKESGGWVRQG